MTAINRKLVNILLEPMNNVGIKVHKTIVEKILEKIKDENMARIYGIALLIIYTQNRLIKLWDKYYKIPGYGTTKLSMNPSLAKEIKELEEKINKIKKSFNNFINENKGYVIENPTTNKMVIQAYLDILENIIFEIVEKKGMFRIYANIFLKVFNQFILEKRFRTHEIKQISKIYKELDKKLGENFYDPQSDPLPNMTQNETHNTSTTEHFSIPNPSKVYPLPSQSGGQELKELEERIEYLEDSYAVIQTDIDEIKKKLDKLISNFQTFEDYVREKFRSYDNLINSGGNGLNHKEDENIIRRIEGIEKEIYTISNQLEEQRLILENLLSYKGRRQDVNSDDEAIFEELEKGIHEIEETSVQAPSKAKAGNPDFNKLLSSFLESRIYKIYLNKAPKDPEERIFYFLAIAPLEGEKEISIKVYRNLLEFYDKKSLLDKIFSYMKKILPKEKLTPFHLDFIRNILLKEFYSTNT